MGVVHGCGDYFDHLKVCASAPWPHVHDLTTTRDVRHVCADSEHHTDGGGVVQVEGGPQPGAPKEKIEFKAEEDTVDALGNTVKAVKRKVKLSRKELKAKQRARAAKIKAGEPVSDEEDDWDDL